MAAWRRDPEAQPGSGGAVVSHGADGKSLRCRGHRRRAGGTHRRPLPGPGPLPGRGRGKGPLRRPDHHYRRSGQFPRGGANQRRRAHGNDAETGRVLRCGIPPGGGHRTGSHRRCENRADQPWRFEVLRRPAGHRRPSPHGGLPGGRSSSGAGAWPTAPPATGSSLPARMSLWWAAASRPPRRACSLPSTPAM